MSGDNDKTSYWSDESEKSIFDWWYGSHDDDGGHHDTHDTITTTITITITTVMTTTRHPRRCLTGSSRGRRVPT
ncbi:MAG: hypothetical protein H5U19_04705 [Rhodobacteraceae bacterium]|nr:hypothetical protein [Paracoccaceae bacterium]